jgi:hypothetical protein
MPFKKLGDDDYTGPSGKHFDKAQVRLYYANGGKFPGQQAHAGGGTVNKGYQGKVESFAAGGQVLGRTRDFMKIPDQFTDGRMPPKDKGSPDDPPQEYTKTGKGGKMSKITGDKELPCKKPRT